MKVTQEWIQKQSQATPVLYLDLDGTVRHGKNELGHFANKASEVFVFPEVPPLLAEYKRKGWRVVAISNQGGVALGYLTDVACAEMMMETQRQCDGLFDQICYCTHHPDATDPEYAICWCRKPRIGLILTAANGLAARYNEYYPPHLALFVGDRPEDEQCAANAGIQFLNAADWRAGAHKPKPQSYVTLDETKKPT